MKNLNYLSLIFLLNLWFRCVGYSPQVFLKGLPQLPDLSNALFSLTGSYPDNLCDSLTRASKLIKTIPHILVPENSSLSLGDAEDILGRMNISFLNGSLLPEKESDVDELIFFGSGLKNYIHTIGKLIGYSSKGLSEMILNYHFSGIKIMSIKGIP